MTIFHGDPSSMMSSSLSMAMAMPAMPRRRPELQSLMIEAGCTIKAGCTSSPHLHFHFFSSAAPETAADARRRSCSVGAPRRANANSGWRLVRP